MEKDQQQAPYSSVPTDQQQSPADQQQSPAKNAEGQY